MIRTKDLSISRETNGRYDIRSQEMRLLQRGFLAREVFGTDWVTLLGLVIDRVDHIRASGFLVCVGELSLALGDLFQLRVRCF